MTQWIWLISFAIASTYEVFQLFKAKEKNDLVGVLAYGIMLLALTVMFSAAMIITRVLQ